MLLLESSSLSRIETIISHLCNRLAVECADERLVLTVFLAQRPPPLPSVSDGDIATATSDTRGTTYVISHYALRPMEPDENDTDDDNGTDGNGCDDYSWLRDVCAEYRETLRRFRTNENDLVWRERARVLYRLRITVEEYATDSSSPPTVSRRDVVAARIFFLWYKIHIFLPVEEVPWAASKRNFAIDRRNDTIEIFDDEHCEAARSLRIATAGERETVRESGAAATEMARRLAAIEAACAATVPTEFTVIDDTRSLGTASRDECGEIFVLFRQPRIQQAKQLPGVAIADAGNCDIVEIAASLPPLIDAETGRVLHTAGADAGVVSRNVSIEPSTTNIGELSRPATAAAVATRQTLTPEQKRVSRLARQLLDPPAPDTLNAILACEYECRAENSCLLDDDNDDDLLTAADAIATIDPTDGHSSTAVSAATQSATAASIAAATNSATVSSTVTATSIAAATNSATVTSIVTATTTHRDEFGPIATTMTVRTVVTRRRRQTRLLIDGVAGAGKTFLIGALLPRFAAVQYLVKKKNFVAATQKRFEPYRCNERLRACTVDAFLMRTLNVRSLVEWLRMLRDEFDELCEMARSSHAEPYVQDWYEGAAAKKRGVLFFIDEFGLLESRLSHLLDIVLRDYRVLLVGDCNQQTAIGETADQAIHTIFLYENVCFMYDNVRAKDPRMLQRLAQFSTRTETIVRSAIDGLPCDSRVDLRDYLAAVATARTDAEMDRARRELPRIIVHSNRTVNFLNWAISRMIWRYARCAERGGFDDDGDVSWDETPPTTDYGRPRRRLIARFARSGTLLRALRYRRYVYCADGSNGKKRTEGDGGSDENGDRTTVTANLTTERCEETKWCEEPRLFDRKRAMDDDRDDCPQRKRSRPLSPLSVRGTTRDDPFADEHFVIVGLRYRMIHTLCQNALIIGTRVIVRAIESPNTVVVELDEDTSGARYRVHRCMVHSYEYNSSFDGQKARFYMFPFVLDAATSVYQVQGVTISVVQYIKCYIDFFGMDARALYVTMSRFENQDQICGVINSNFVH